MIEENLTQLRDSFKTLGGNGAWLLYDFVLRYGKCYRGIPLPKRYAPRTPKACFFNARALVLRAKEKQIFIYGVDVPKPPEIDFAEESPNFAT